MTFTLFNPKKNKSTWTNTEDTLLSSPWLGHLGQSHTDRKSERGLQRPGGSGRHSGLLFPVHRFSLEQRDDSGEDGDGGELQCVHMHHHGLAHLKTVKVLSHILQQRKFQEVTPWEGLEYALSFC